MLFCIFAASKLLIFDYGNFSLTIEYNKINDNINATEKLKNGIRGTFKKNGFPKFRVKAETISKAVIIRL